MTTAPVNLATPYFEPGDALTAYCEAAVTGKRFVKISDDLQGTGTPGLDTGGASSGTITVSPCSTGEHAIGVAEKDQAIDGLVGVLLAGVVPVTAQGSITAGEEVMSYSNGKAVRITGGGLALGMCLADVTTGNDAMIYLYDNTGHAANLVAGDNYAAGTPQAVVADVATTTAKTVVGTTPAATAATAATVSTADGSDTGSTQTLANALKVELNKVIADNVSTRATLELIRVDLNKAEDDIASIYTRLAADMVAINRHNDTFEEYGQQATS